MHNILILDDDELQAQHLQQIIQSNIPNCKTRICTSVQDAVVEATNETYQIMILDIMLQDGTGIGFAKWARTLQKYENVWIIMVTGYDSFMLESIKDVHCYDYILKPYKDNEVLAVLTRLISLNITKSSSQSYLSVVSKGVSFRIRLNDIVYIEINNKNMDIHTESIVYSIKRYPLNKIKSQLPQGMFVQCHRSFIINSSKISAIETKSRETFVRMNNCELPIPVGIRYKGLISTDIAL